MTSADENAAGSGPVAAANSGAPGAGGTGSASPPPACWARRR